MLQYALVLICLLPIFPNVNAKEEVQVIFEWNYINYTWPTVKDYENAIKTGSYIPGAVLMIGIKLYKDKIFLCMPRQTTAVPVTLGYISTNDDYKNPLLSPFPSWELNALDGDCSKLVSVQSFEIDTKGVAWILDGTRKDGTTTCPAKLMLIAVQTGKVIHVKVFPEEIALSEGGWLCDIVLDDSDGGYAYITDSSAIDRGLIVYSRAKDEVWKFRDTTMFAELNLPSFAVNGFKFDTLIPINGIALSPRSMKERLVYYTSIYGLSVYSISTKILKNATILESADWRRQVKLLGQRITPSDGMIMDSAGMLYLGQVTLNAVGRWNSNKPFEIEIAYQNNDTLIWPDSFGCDNNGSLYALSTSVPETVITKDNIPESPPKDPKYRIWKLYTGTNNYMY